MLGVVEVPLKHLPIVGVHLLLDELPLRFGLELRADCTDSRVKNRRTKGIRPPSESEYTPVPEASKWMNATF